MLLKYVKREQSTVITITNSTKIVHTRTFVSSFVATTITTCSQLKNGLPLSKRVYVQQLYLHSCCLQLALNLSALSELHPGSVADLKMAVRQALYDGVEDVKEQAWLMFALEVLSSQSCSLDLNGTIFYEKVLQQDWVDLPKSPVQMLAEMPVDIDNHKFNINTVAYVKNRYVNL